MAGELIGREEELDAALTAFATLPAIVALEGEAGIGNARERFLELTHGDADAVGPDTPLEVIAHHEAELVRPVEEKAQAAARERDVLQEKIVEQEKQLAAQASTLASQGTQLDQQGGTIAELKRWMREEEAEKDKKLKRRKFIGAVSAVLTAAALAITLPTTDVVQGKVSTAALVVSCATIALLFVGDSSRAVESLAGCIGR